MNLNYNFVYALILICILCTVSAQDTDSVPELVYPFHNYGNVVVIKKSSNLISDSIKINFDSKNKPITGQIGKSKQKHFFDSNGVMRFASWEFKPGWNSVCLGNNDSGCLVEIDKLILAENSDQDIEKLVIAPCFQFISLKRTGSSDAFASLIEILNQNFSQEKNLVFKINVLNDRTGANAAAEFYLKQKETEKTDQSTTARYSVENFPSATIEITISAKKTNSFIFIELMNENRAAPLEFSDEFIDAIKYGAKNIAFELSGFEYTRYAKDDSESFAQLGALVNEFRAVNQETREGFAGIVPWTDSQAVLSEAISYLDNLDAGSDDRHLLQNSIDSFSKALNETFWDRKQLSFEYADEVLGNISKGTKSAQDAITLIKDDAAKDILISAGIIMPFYVAYQAALDTGIATLIYKGYGPEHTFELENGLNKIFSSSINENNLQETASLRIDEMLKLLQDEAGELTPKVNVLNKNKVEKKADETAGTEVLETNSGGHSKKNLMTLGLLVALIVLLAFLIPIIKKARIVD